MYEVRDLENLTQRTSGNLSSHAVIPWKFWAEKTQEGT